MHYSEARGNRWAEYESAVKDLLEDPKTAPWLDGPLDQDWSESLYEELGDQDRTIAKGRTRVSRPMRRLDHVAMTGAIIFWMSHITAALAFVLITNASGRKIHPMAEV